MSKPRQTIKVVPIETLTAHPGNVREDLGDLTELARSIVEHGILEPLVVTEVPGHSGRYLVLGGHRRLGAACMANQTSVPVVIRHGVTDETEQIALMLVENGHRKDLSAVEKAEAFGALRNHGLNQTAIAKLTGYRSSTINYYLTLLDLDEESLEAVRTGDLQSTVAIQAVQDARQARRVAAAQPERGRPKVVEKPHFGSEHPLLPYVMRACDHTTRPKINNTHGCGQCWEAVIRADALGEPMPAAGFDEVVVQRILSGAPNVHASGADRCEVVRRTRLSPERSLAQLAMQTGWKVERYVIPEDRQQVAS